MDTDHEAHSMSRTGPDGGGAKPRACANCARLKIKCRWPEYGNGNPDAACLRCARMKFSCHVPAATQKRKRGKSTRVAQLEEKLDGIVSLLAAHRHLQASSMSPTPPEPSKEPRESPREAVRPNNANSREPLGRDVEDLSAMYRLFPGFSLTGEQATAYLEIYQTELMPNFPFVVIPPSMDAHALYSQSPSLFWVTMAAVAPQSLAIQEEVRKWLRQYIAEHMIVKQEKSLQLLQTLLLHMAWSDYHYYVYSDATNFLQLAMSLVIDLRLDKSPDTTGVMPKSLLGETWTALNKGAPYRLGVPHTLAEKRAVLGFYHFSSIVSLLFRRGAQLPWNHYLSQCCDSLLDAREYEGDMYAVALVRMQCISDRVSGFLPPTGTGDRDNSVYRPPLEMAIKSLRAELDRFAHSQPAFVSHNNVFWAYYHGLVMRLYEPIISMRVSPASSSDTFSSETFQRTESLWKCLESAADFFGSLQAIPSTQLPLLPLTANALLALVVVTTSRLLLLEVSNDWDSAPARRKLDFAAALDRIADLFEQADRWAQGAGRRRRPQEDTENAPCMYTFRLRWVRQWYLSKISHSDMPHQQQQPRTSGARPAQALTANQWGDVSLEDMDMDFWPELFYGPIPEVTLPTPPVMGWSM